MDSGSWAGMTGFVLGGVYWVGWWLVSIDSGSVAGMTGFVLSNVS